MAAYTVDNNKNCLVRTTEAKVTVTFTEKLTEKKQKQKITVGCLSETTSRDRLVNLN